MPLGIPTPLAVTRVERIVLTLSGEAIGIEEIDDGVAQLWFGPIYLGLLKQIGNKQLEFIENEG